MAPIPPGTPAPTAWPPPPPPLPTDPKGGAGFNPPPPHLNLSSLCHPGRLPCPEQGVPAGSGTGTAGADRSRATGYVKVPECFPPASIHFAARRPIGSPAVMAEPPAHTAARCSPGSVPVGAQFRQRQSLDAKVIPSVILHFAGRVLRISAAGAAEPGGTPPCFILGG